jgi:hypothetical protein
MDVLCSITFALDVTQLELYLIFFYQTFISEVQQLKSWADRILGVHVDFENQCNDNKNKISSGLSLVREKCDHLSQETTTTLDLQLARRIERLNAYEAQTEELLDTVSNSREAVSTTFMQDNTLSYTANCLVVLLLYCYLFTAN